MSETEEEQAVVVVREDEEAVAIQGEEDGDGEAKSQTVIKVAASAEDGKAKDRARRESTADKARLKLRRGWRNDDAALNSYFQSCVTNWKIYKGKRDPKQVMKLQSIYRQALYGDNTTPMPQNLKSVNGLKWQAWMALKGIPQEMSKRRFITYLAEIDPKLIDVMPNEEPPKGFCRDNNDKAICAKCNTVSGCSRPILDQYKIDLKDQLYDSDELHEPQALRKWVQNALMHQQCVWGFHKPVPKIDCKPFAEWFNKDENGGYQAYESEHVYDLVRELLHYHFEIGYDMQINIEQYSAESFNAQSVKVGKLKGIYEELSGDRFVFEAPCRANTTLCNELRAAENRNHTHPVDLSPPTHQDVDDYESSIELRKQCQKLGLKATTGVVENVQERCTIYRERIANYFEGLKIAGQAATRLNKRIDEHAKEKAEIATLGRDMIQRQASDACHSMKIDHVLTLIRRGCSASVETSRGLTPTLTAVLTAAPTELIEELVTRKANLNAVNMYGMTPLMMACRMKDTKMIHALMRLGSSALQDGGRAGKGLTAMHWCAVHGSEEEAKIILEYVKEGGGDSMRMSRVLDCQSESGDTPMMLAARIRNGLMCKALAGLGANPNTRNDENRNACNIARTAGWTELADWLEKKVGAGVAKLETYSDQQYDKMVRYGKVRTQESIEEFGRVYLGLVYRSSSVCPLGPPSVAITQVQDIGRRAHDSQLALSNNHVLYIRNKTEDGKEWKPSQKEQDIERKEALVKLNAIMNDNMLVQIQQGKAAPNTEALQKPLPWTPLMCATCLNNVRTIRLLVRDGADPNHANMQGTTPVMLAAQLQNLEALVELLVLGADLKSVDNFGYTALAYATSLPIPTLFEKEATNFIMDADTDAPKHRDAAAIIKLATTSGLEVTRDKIKESEDEASRTAVENHFRFMRLLESYGLSRLQNVKQLQSALGSVEWKLGEDDHVKIAAQEFSETSSEARERAHLQAHRDEIAEHQEPEDDSSVLRCPICTLTVPCPHFFKAETLQKFFEKNTPAEAEVSTGSALQDMLNATAMRKKFAEEHKKNARRKILQEVGIEDRDTDRSIAFAKKYRAREMELDRLAKERQEAKTKRIKDEQEAEDAMEQGLGWQEKEEKKDDKTLLYYQHDITQVRWDANPDGQGQTYFHNPATNETLWDVPGLAEWIVKNNQDKADAAEKAAFMEEARLAKEERKAKKAAKKAEKEGKKGGKGKGKEKDKTGAEIAAELAQKAKKADSDAQYTDRKAEKGRVLEALQKAQDSANSQMNLGGDQKVVVLHDFQAELEKKMFEVSTNRKKNVVDENGVETEVDVRDAENAEIDTAETFEAQISSKKANLTTPKSILKKGNKEDLMQGGKRPRGLTFVEGDIDPTPEVRKIYIDGGAGDPPSTPLSGSSAMVVLRADSAGGDGTAPDSGDETSVNSNSNDNSSNCGENGESGGGDANESEDSRPTSPLAGSPTITKGEAAAMKLITGSDLEGGELSEDILKNLTIAQGREAEHGETAGGALDILKNEMKSAREHADGITIPDGGLDDDEKELTKDEKFRLRKGVNPYPPDARRLFSFTKEPLGAVKHLVRTDKELTLKQHKKLVRENTNKSSLRSLLDGIDSESLTPSYDVTSQAKRRSSAPKALMREPNKVSISGWVFLSLSSPDIQPPVDKVDLPLEMWSGMVEHLRMKFEAEWVDRLHLRSMVSSNTLVAVTPRCSACKVGFVRTKPNPDNKAEPNDICFACMVRKELYERAQQVFPRTFRRKASSQWPFNVTKGEQGGDEDVTEEQLGLVKFDPKVSPLHRVNKTLDPTSPIHSRQIAELDVRQTADDIVRDGRIGELKALTNGEDSAVLGDMTMTIGYRGHLSSVQLAQGLPPIELESGSIDDEGSLTTLGRKSLASLTGKSPEKPPKKKTRAQIAVEEKEQKKMDRLPDELGILPFMLAKGLYDDVDRTVRAAVAQRNVDEGGGALFLANAMAIQADMYKMMGLYPLALGTYLEAFDLLIGILGFNATPTMNAFGWVSSCLIKMRCPALSKEWVHNVCRALETESLSHNMYQQSKALLDADRGMKKKLVVNEHLWVKMILPKIKEREEDLLWNHPSRDYRWTLFKYCGYPAVYRMFANHDGYSLVARQAFEEHCIAFDPKRLGRYAQFAAQCFQLRLVVNLDTYRHMVQQLIQKYLGKAPTESTCEIGPVFRKITSEEQQEDIAQFLQFGLPVTVDTFDAILFHSLKVLGNSGEFLFFYLRDGAGGLRDRNPEESEACFHAVATKIQIPAMMKLARLKCNKMRKFNEEEAARKLAEYNEENGIREETEEEAKARRKAERKAEKKRKQQELMDAGLAFEDD